MKGLYVHIPFCARKCDYCDFLSFAAGSECYGDYIAALEREMSVYHGTAVDTIFIGGGTPSVLSAEMIGRLCSLIKKRFVLDAAVEWTMEVNPGTVDADKIAAMRTGGVNRVSIGVQSFNDSELAAVGRIHNAATAADTVRMFANRGFSDISIDLMMSLPYQTEKSFKNSLEQAVALPITHISVYSLIIEDGTPIKEKYDSGVFAEPDEDTDRELYSYTKRFLQSHGFKRYEISNYARDGFESRHNIKYWDCDEYIGVGLGAASYVDGVRRSNTRDMEGYMSGRFFEGDGEKLTERDKMGEFMMLGLRKTEGVSIAEFEKRFGCDVRSVYKHVIDKFTAAELLECGDGFIRLSEHGLDLANTVMCEFL